MDAQVPFVFSTPWPEARDEAGGDGDLKESPGAELTIAEKRNHSFNYALKLGGFFVLVYLFLALETFLKNWTKYRRVEVL
jgi:hypothetical protein